MANFGSIDVDLATSQQNNGQDWANRLMIDYLQTHQTQSEPMAEGMDVIAGLSQTPKILPVKYFYDDRGSQLFEQICDLPEYYLTRTETAILLESGREIAQQTGACELVELGSGSSTKTRLLLNAYQSFDYTLCYRPIDVSAGILQASAQQLLQDYPTLKIHALVGTYEQALQQLSKAYLPHRLILFLGSTLGNLSPQECDRFFQQLSQVLQPSDYLLLGVDLHKATHQLEAAYNDNQGLTAAFNLNMLNHLNQRFAGNFDLSHFSHHAFYNEAAQQIEMHLRSDIQQTIQLQKLNFSFTLEAGETIRSEISRKFNLQTLQAQMQTHQLNPLKIWTDVNPWFALVLCQKNHGIDSSVTYSDGQSA
jgi:L-histidine Nalpha-methyltransferase